MRRKVVVTGGNGFVGSHLVQALVGSGVEVHAIANQHNERLRTYLPPEQIHVLQGDPYAASELVIRLQPDTIFHLAAVYEEPVSIGCIATMIEGNLSLGTALLFGASKCDRPAAFVNTGTYWQFSTSGEYAPNTVYAATKQAFQDVLYFYERKGFVSAVTLVLYDTVGEGDWRAKLWSFLMKQSAGTVIPLSEGDQFVELMTIQDVVRAFLHAADLLTGGEKLKAAYAIRSGRKRTLKEMVLEFNERAELGLTFAWGAKPYWEGQVFDPWEGELLPGWFPEQSVMDEMLRFAREERARRMVQETHP